MATETTTFWSPPAVPRLAVQVMLLGPHAVTAHGALPTTTALPLPVKTYADPAVAPTHGSASLGARPKPEPVMVMAEPCALTEVIHGWKLADEKYTKPGSDCAPDASTTLACGLPVASRR